MILESGVASENFECTDCKTTHYNVQIGEEALVCGCGKTLVLVKHKDVSMYLWLGREGVRRKEQRAINDDPRNLC